MPDNKNSNVGFKTSIHDQIGENSQRKNSATILARFSRMWMLDQELDSMFELAEKTLRN